MPSEAVWLALIAAVVAMITTIVTPLVQMLVSQRQRKHDLEMKGADAKLAEAQARALRLQLITVAEDVAVVKHETNSMKDALIKAEFIKGEEVGRNKALAEAEELRLKGREDDVEAKENEP